MFIEWVDNSTKIVSIKSMGDNFSCNPCFNDNDKLVKTKAKDDVINIGNNEHLKKDKLHLNAIVGGSFGMVASKLSGRNFDKLNYVDVPISGREVGFKDASVSSFFDAGVRVEMLFGKKTSRFGLYLGLDYTKINASFTADTIFQSFYTNGSSFNHYLTYNNVEEQVSVSAVGIPLGFSGEIHVSDKLKVYVGAGAKLLVSSSVSSNYSTQADNEFVLHYDDNGQPIVDATGEIDQQDWVFTTEAVPAGIDADAYFARAAELGYPVTIGNPINEETEKVSLGFALQGQVVAGIRYFVTPTIFLQPGIMLSYTSWANKGPENQPNDLNTTPYYSNIYYTSKLSALQVGINFSIGFNLTK